MHAVTDNRPPAGHARVLAWLKTHRSRLALIFAGVLLPLCVFGFIADDIREKHAFAFDQSLLMALHRNASPSLDQAMLFFTLLGSARVIVPVEAIVLLGLLKLRRFADGLFWILAPGGASLLNYLTKHLFGRIRPSLWISIAPQTTYSFPSAHAMQTMALIAASMVLLWPTRWRWMAFAPGVAYVALVGISRLYLGVHYPTDVLAGWCASLAWVLSLSVILYGRMTKPSRHAAPIAT